MEFHWIEGPFIVDPPEAEVYGSLGFQGPYRAWLKVNIYKYINGMPVDAQTCSK